MLVQCLQSLILSNTTQSRVLWTMRKKNIENIVQKGEKRNLQQTLPLDFKINFFLLDGKEFPFMLFSVQKLGLYLTTNSPYFYGH